MAKRSITDDEIALIKAMQIRGFKNKDIQFYFNRPDRPVNSGRISGIRSETYGGSAAVPAAPNAALDSFLAAHADGKKHLTSSSAHSDTPWSHNRIAKCFAKGSDGVWRLVVKESDHFECKASFGFKYQGKWLRAIAALANNDGGYIFFGVNDKDVKGPKGEDLSYAVVGLDNNEFASADPADLATRVKSMFDPTPAIQIAVAKIGEKNVGVLYVHRHDSRPVIATKQDGDIKEGDIFYRYPGQSSRIKYSDLRAMLDARDAEARTQILPMVERLLQLGPTRSMITDLDEGIMADGKRTIQIDQNLIEKLTFIKEGQFSETDGAPTLRLIGEVQPIDGTSKAKQHLGVLTRADFLAAFLDQAKPDDPKEYIRFALEVATNERLPLHYFSRLAKLDNEGLMEFINNTNGPSARKKKCIKWLKPNAAYQAAVGKPKGILAEIIAGKLPTISTPTEASHAAQAILALPSSATFEIGSILTLLKRCLVVAGTTSAISFVRRAICRVDELKFSSSS
ncbi:hypothetical protein FRZ44_47980 [Hypericibacter terrae]|uniref:Schlafen AlbA-2 domain-containing protein n=1 Tax=Hypericibacter terrae TaxID=2602015 RepID=A0A5J6MPW7_9PROT|nr:ATP-binding protein [Hypericibacter terrae]QEX19484.1 hypothetical protein FRZ44_47980 [Hypericibacter terrae]